MLRIHETTKADGAFEETVLTAEGTSVSLLVGGCLVGRLPAAALDVVMHRYGKPLEEGIVLDGPSLRVDGGRTVYMLRHLARYDVIAKDYFVLVAPNMAPLAELATSVAGALVHLARAATAAEST